MQSQPTNFPSLTKRNNKQQKKNNNLPYKSAYSYRYLRTYFKRARPPLVLPNVAYRIH